MESQGEVMTAESAMIGALRLAEPEWMVRIVADAPAPARNVLGRVAPADVTPAFLEAVRSAAGITGNRSAALTGRERDVLERLARGLSNKAIAHQLGVSVATVKTHLIHIFRKLGAGSRTQAITNASARGLIRPLH
jgi:DNA-binding NarL/FixJ family response regulator